MVISFPDQRFGELGDLRVANLPNNLSRMGYHSPAIDKTFVTNQLSKMVVDSYFLSKVYHDTQFWQYTTDANATALSILITEPC